MDVSCTEHRQQSKGWYFPCYVPLSASISTIRTACLLLCLTFLQKQGGAETVASSSASGNKYDINDRATKHRRGNNNLGNFGGGLGSTDARVAAAENGRAEGRSPNSSRSSSISSEAESFSSDDSDIAQVQKYCTFCDGG